MRYAHAESFLIVMGSFVPCDMKKLREKIFVTKCVFVIYRMDSHKYENIKK